jgi:uncharacterized protein
MLDSIQEHWLIIGTALPTLIIAWIVALLSKYVRLMLNIIRDTPPALFMGPFDFDRVDGRHVMFRAFDGTILRGMFLSKSMVANNGKKNSGAAGDSPISIDNTADYLNGRTRGVAIFCHEYGSDMYSCMRYCRGLLEAGFDIFTFDFRSHGHSSGLPGYQPRLWPSDKEMFDCLGAMAFVQDELESRNLNIRIGLFGISRGAGAAILAAAYAQDRMPVHAVLTDSAFSTDTTLEWSMKKWVHIFARVRLVYENHPEVFWRFLRWLLLRFANMRFHCRFPSVREMVGQLRDIPVFFIHGVKDSYIRSEQAELLYSRAKTRRYLWLVPDAKHNQAAVVDPIRYAARTVAFFEKFIASDSSGQPRIADSPPRVEAVEFFTPVNNISHSEEIRQSPYKDAHCDPTAGTDSRSRRRVECIPVAEKVRKSGEQLSAGSN